MRRLLLPLLLGVVALLGVPNAFGGGHAFEDEVILQIFESDLSNDEFFAQVDSAEAMCKADRKISFFEALKGPDKKIGTATTSENGAASIEKESKKGKNYYSKLKKAELKTGDTCKPDTSNKVKGE